MLFVAVVVAVVANTKQKLKEEQAEVEWKKCKARKVVIMMKTSGKQ